MQCFICVTYMIIMCSANPMKTQELATTHEKRSLFRDVIESLRLHSRLPDDINHNDVNHLSQNFDKYEDEPSHLPSDSDYFPRRNDRIEMPSLKYRFPRNIYKTNDKSKEHVVLYIDTHPPQQNAQKNKNDKTHQRPYSNKPKLPNKTKDTELNETEQEDNLPLTNTMSGQSQIGNRESQMVVKPTIIVNIRGSLSNRDSDIRLEARDDDNSTAPLHNIFNINQEVKIGSDIDKKKNPSVSQEIKLTPVKEMAREEDGMLLCETATWKADNASQGRKFDVFQILFSL